MSAAGVPRGVGDGGFAERLERLPAEQAPHYLIGGIEGVLGRERLTDAERVEAIRYMLAAFEQGRQHADASPSVGMLHLLDNDTDGGLP